MKKRWLQITLLLLAMLMVLPLAAFAEEEQVETIAIDDGGADESDDLIWGYLFQEAGMGYGIQTFGVNTSLTGANKQVFDGMLPKLKSIAQKGGSTKITVSYSGSARPDLNVVHHALLENLPYDLYWYDKTTGAKVTWGTQSVTFSFTVVKRYRQNGDVYKVNASVADIKTAADNAKAIVNAYSSLDDFDKLQAYRETICDLVSYNWSAVSASYTGGYGDPWQVIYVFDGKTSTNVVCEGYSKALKYLCDLSAWNQDVECLIVTGNCGGAHMWNVVRVGNTKYLADVTNCDSGSIGYPDKLFLCGGQNTTNGYKTNGMEYIYDSVMFSEYNTSDLRLSIQVAYELNGGTNNSKNPSMYHYNGTVTLQKPTRKGYTLAGWYLDSALTKVVKDGKITSTVANTANRKLTLYAKWTPTKYTITYDPKGGTNAAGNPATYTMTTATITLLPPTRKGCTFVGWYDTTDDSPVTEIPKGSTGNRSIYAKWKAIPYTISYELNGGTNHSGNPATYTVVQEVLLQKPTRKGYTFVGWFRDSALTDQVTKIAKGSIGDRTLYAKWSKTKYTISYDPKGGTNAAENPTYYYVNSATITLLPPTRKGCTFTGWYNVSDDTPVTEIPKGSTGNRSLYAKWKAITYTITYELNDGKNSADNPSTYTVVKEVVLKNPTRKGYGFDGWYKDSAFKTQVTKIAKGSTGNRTLYAKWTKKVYTISYVLNGGTNNDANPAKYTISSKTITLAKPRKSGYTFVGWYKDSAFTKKITEIPNGSAGNLKLYARWKKK